MQSTAIINCLTGRSDIDFFLILRDYQSHFIFDLLLNELHLTLLDFFLDVLGSFLQEVSMQIEPFLLLG